MAVTKNADRRDKGTQKTQWPQAPATSPRAKTIQSSRRRERMQRGRLSKRKGPADGTVSDGEDPSSDAMSLDGGESDHEDADEHLVATAIGHMIVDMPNHPMYEQHVRTIVSRSGSGIEGRRGLHKLVKRLRESAVEMGVPENTELAVSKLKESWYAKEATMSAKHIDDEDILANVTATFMSQQVQRRGDGFNTRSFLGKVQERVNRKLDVPTKRVPAFDKDPHQAVRDNADADRVGTCDDRLFNVGRSVDVVWDAELLRKIPKDTAKEILADCFKTPRDLFIANHIAESEVTDYDQGANTELAQQYDQARKAWTFLSGRMQKTWFARFEGLLAGNINELVTREPDDDRKALKCAFQNSRRQYTLTHPRLAPSKSGPADPPSVKPSGAQSEKSPAAYAATEKAQQSDGTSLDPTGTMIKEEHGSTRPAPFVPPPASVPQTTASKQPQLKTQVPATQGNSRGVAGSDLRPGIRDGVLVNLHWIRQIDNVMIACQKAFRMFGYQGVERHGSMWFVILGSRDEALRAAEGRKTVGSQYCYPQVSRS